MFPSKCRVFISLSAPLKEQRAFFRWVVTAPRTECYRHWGIETGIGLAIVFGTSWLCTFTCFHPVDTPWQWWGLLAFFSITRTRMSIGEDSTIGC